MMAFKPTEAFAWTSRIHAPSPIIRTPGLDRPKDKMFWVVF
jgi:hypothetical protein